MASNSAEKSPNRKAKRQAPQIDIAVPQTASIELAAPEAPARNIEAEQVRDRHEKAAQENWEKLFAALFKINYPDLPVSAAINHPHSRQDSHFVRTLSAEYAFNAQEGKLVLSRGRHDILVDQKQIVFNQGAPEANEDQNDFDLKSALVMARLAAQNPLMIEKGIRLGGSEEQIALLRQAVLQVNEAQPEGRKLRIVNDAADKPAPQPAPTNAFTQSAQPYQMFQPSTQAPVGAKKDVQAPKEAKSEKANPQPVPTAADKDRREKGERVAAATKPAEPQRVVRDARTGAGQTDAKTNAKETPEADASLAKTPRQSVLGRMAAALKPKEIPFREGRRRAMTIAGAALVTGVILKPEQSQAADMIQPEPKKIGFWERLFGIKRNDHYERQKAGSGLHNKKQNAKTPKQETRKQKAARLKKEQEQAARAKKAGKAGQAKKETAAQKADRVKREQEQARKKPKKKQETQREKASRLKKEKQDAQAKKPESKAEKAKRLKQEKADANKNNTSNATAKGKITFINPHNGERMTANLRGLGSCCGQFNHLARDWRRNEIINIDSKLLDYIERICGNLQSQGKQVKVVNIVCGYRSPKTNQQLIAASKKRNGGKSGVAQNSYHLYGRALDISIEGVSTAALYNAACSALGNSGGARRYSGNGFVHIDTRTNKHRCIVS